MSVKRALVNLLVKFRRLTKSVQNITKEERNAIIIVNKLSRDRNTELLMTASHDKYYIKSKDDNIFVVYNNYNNEINIINHIYNYNVKLNSRSSKCILNRLVDEIDTRREIMEKEYTSNIQHSLTEVARSLSK